MADRITVVVPVLNEAASLGALLADLDQQALPPAEVIVVDAGSNDGTRELLRDAELRSERLRVIHLDGATPGRGRNAGIDAAATPLIATLDAGSRVDREWLATLSGPLREHGNRLVCVGEAVADARSEFERAAGWLTLRAHKPLGGRRPTGASYLPAGRNGLCFQRVGWQEAGGYPDEFAVGEDKVFLQRLRECGIELLPVRAAVVHWRPRSTLDSLYQQYRAYGHGDAFAAIDRSNELVPLALYGAGAALAVAARGNRRAATVLGVAAGSYLGVFVAPAWRDLGWGRALCWVPAVRVTVDLAKIHGFVAGLRARTRAGV